MLNQSFIRIRFFLAAMCAVLFISALGISAQDSKSSPELSVAGIELGNRASAEKFLSKYTPRINEEGRVTYSFYNEFGTQVMTLTAALMDDRFFIKEIEVFAVDRSYMKKHFVARDIGFFATENGIFIGYRQSAVSMIVGIPNAGREDRIGPRDVIRKKGAPVERVKEGKLERFFYSANIQSANDSIRYEAFYQFYNDRLNRFSIKLVQS